ncbi:hypothetical protein BWP39_29220 [Paraburkholderia acidicola]|uniref:Uncharacterized protein n=1 Tax=Paraburkholderia acidicola TaxID=1912599 RepID=A0A2A4EQ55_9BURK|nr:hypothetical protein [Paraburkholderia acidicola]PCE23763.1 hypothetical protein BWP39_29220 [Paraburkholderia acidicola]
MSVTARSLEANAAERFVRASRKVDMAFRIVRGEPAPESREIEHSLAVLQLEQALDELAEAEALFDMSVSTGTPRRAN